MKKHLQLKINKQRRNNGQYWQYDETSTTNAKKNHKKNIQNSKYGPFLVKKLARPKKSTPFLDPTIQEFRVAQFPGDLGLKLGLKWV